MTPREQIAPILDFHRLFIVPEYDPPCSGRDLKWRRRTNARTATEIQNRIDRGPHHAGRAKFRRCTQDMVENSQHLVVIPNPDLLVNSR
jgi:hypothetical protein